jgi:hypothetical protein
MKARLALEKLKEGIDIIGHGLQPRAMRSTAYHENAHASLYPALRAESFDISKLGAGPFPW